MSNTTIYEKLRAAGCEIDNHYSDLYVKATPEARQVLADYEFRSNVRAFVSNIDGAVWFDVPFAFDPFWLAKAGAK